MVKIGIRADGGPNIGIGHIERCLTLSQQLRKDGAEIFFITKRNKSVSEKIRAEGFDILEFSPDLNLVEDLRYTLHKLNIKRAKIAITDSYAIEEYYLNQLAALTELITIDDFASFSFPSDIVINQNIYADKLKYRSLTSKTKFLLGPKFALLRPEYSNLERRKIESKIKKILITLGGADFHNLTPRILEVLGAIDQDFSITIMIGTFFTSQRQIMKAMQKFQSKTIRLIRFKNEFHKILFEHDLAITGGGTTTYALAATGTPALSFRLANNQKQNIQSLANYGTLIDLGWGNKLDKTRLKKLVINLMENFHLRQKMAQLGQMLVDGQGVKRICSIIQNKN